MTQDDLDRPGPMPDWVPAAARNYLSHTESGRSIRALARDNGVHASTILRQVRRIETRRDDPLVDAAILALARAGAASFPETTREAPMAKTQQPGPAGRATGDDDPDREALAVLRRLLEPGAVLAVAPEMEKAVVVRDTADGRTLRTAVIERRQAEAMALREWIAPASVKGRVRRYRISSAERSALKTMLAREENARAGFAEAQERFDGAAAAANGVRARAMPRRGAGRYQAAESPVAALARRRDRDGAPFLAPELLAAAERLREDFELSQLGPRVAQNWEGILTGGVETSAAAGAGPSYGPEAARQRVAAALGDLGPGLGDIALRCCCHLEGLEAAERRLGWSSRSAKIVLRIALHRLRRHYEANGGLHDVLIG
ncbi:DUF6456 domain-containing protein [Frigidibacter sp. ROC022]|uniref:DUF6456 domain-containing protein n=1 Tax=Frigidibacter sp. ROC022 TaxID=2971796 RepID=UPI00215A6BFF|nr:DUF6456 domain-containing protein [Frigidibacter sp. ROC022]MCR8723583.1 DUF6456 domain-containing protein [Frigidibacter sp. ROC022]